MNIIRDIYMLVEAAAGWGIFFSPENPPKKFSDVR